MDMNWELIKYTAYAGLLAATIAAQHMAFRTPQWRRRELMRRAIGDVTVLLFALLAVLDGAADLRTWFIIVGGFAIAGAVKVTFAWRDGARRDVMVGQLHGNETSED